MREALGYKFDYAQLVKDCETDLARYVAANVTGQVQTTRGRGWYSLRPQFSSDLMHMPLKVLCKHGSWRNPQTVLRCY